LGEPADRVRVHVNSTDVRSVAEKLNETLSWLVTGEGALPAGLGSVEEMNVTGGVLSTTNLRVSATPCPIGRTWTTGQGEDPERPSDLNLGPLPCPPSLAAPIPSDPVD
jgi:hypothetical protein